jgi:hypothetical protein
VWGNVVECWVQIKPTQSPPDHLVGVITSPALADPIACAENQPILACGLAGVTITGTAGGLGFASYRIEYRPLASPTWIQLGVVYPDCTPASTTPDHTTPRFSAPLAYLTNLSTGAYAVRLRVDGTGGPIYAFTSFSLQYRAVTIDWIGAVVAREMGPHPGDPTEPLKLIRASANPTDPDSSVGGTINIWGSADFNGCDRRMIEYGLQHREVTFPADPWQRDAAGPWIDVKPQLPFGGPGDPLYPREYDCWQGGILGSLVTRPNYVRDNYLNRVWNNHTCLLSPFPLFPLPAGTTHVVRRTEVSSWNTFGLGLNGRFTVRLRLRHQDLALLLPIEEIFDAATVWLDNRQIQAFLAGLGITGGAPLGVCVELSLSQFLGTTADVRGRAWDPLILDSIPATERPNDNFDFYKVQFRKAGSATYFPIATGTTRVPNVLPVSPPGDVGTLATWNIITALDAGPAPSPYVPPPDPKIYRGERCAYLIHLYATDKTLINDGADTHDREDFFPFCIVNDLG